MVNKDVDIEISEATFTLKATFRNIAPLTDDSCEELETSVRANMSRVMGSRTAVFMRLLDLIARRGTETHWRELDVCMTTMAALLEEAGLDGALKSIILEITQSPSGPDGINQSNS